MIISSSVIIQIVAILLLLIGFTCVLSGLNLLAKGTITKELEEVTDEVSKMVQKGILSDVGDSLESASFLLEKMNTMIKTSQGVGLSIIIIGIVLICGGLALLTLVK